MTSLPSPQSPSGETSSLLSGNFSSGETSGERHDDHTFLHRGSASVWETILNEANTCMGTGCLALPYAARLGGVLLHVTGIVGIAMWNVYSVHRLCQCLYLLPKGAVLFDEETDVEHSKVVAKSDSTLSTQEEGDCPALELSPSHERSECHHRISSDDPFPQYEATPNPKHDSSQTQQQSKTPPPPPRGTSTYSRVAWYAFGSGGLFALDILMISLFIGVVVAFVNAIRGFLRDTPFTTGNDVLDAICIAFVLGPMSTAKDMGYLARLSATGIFALCFSFGVISLYGLWAIDDTTSVSSVKFNWFPENGMNGVSTWFGSTVFGYGVAPLTYNFLESMAQPTRMVQASTVALMIVAVVYVFMGVGIYSLFRGVDGDILRILPSEGWLPTLTRLSMAVVVSATAPLLIVPCGQLVEGKILKSSAVANEVPYSIRATVRIGIALLCVAISVLVPGFVSVLSLVGCASVGTVGFVMPPALFLKLRLMRASWTWDLTFDFIMLVWGVFSTLVTTSYTFADVMSSKV